MYLYPHLSTFLILDWKTSPLGKVARFICDVYSPDGQPFSGDPRYILKRNINKMKDLGFSSFNIGFEAEFYLLKTNPDGVPLLEFSDKGGYFDLSPIDGAEEVRREIVVQLEKLGFKVEISHHEVGPGQNEINFKYEDALTACDNIQTFKMVVKNIARNYGLYATFMPKPMEGKAGNGMHTNCSLCTEEGKNAFYDPSMPNELSETCLKWITGLLSHACAFSAITNPTVNSYKRLVSGYEAPCYVAWAFSNRSTMIRIPCARGESTRTEVRSVDGSSNPYLTSAVLLAAGLDGIQHAKVCIPEVSTNLFELTAKQRKVAKIKNLPENLKEALTALNHNDLMKETLGEHLVQKFNAAKLHEWENYRTQVTKWEVDYYLSKL